MQIFDYYKYMAKSLFSNLSVEDRQGQRSKADQRSKKIPQPQLQAPATDPPKTVTFEFRSCDQAAGASKILKYQVEKLKEQADKHDKQKLTYISEMLRDQATIIELMAEKTKQAGQD